MSTCILANSEDPDEILHNDAFHQFLHCMLRQKWSSEKVQYHLEINLLPLMYTNDFSRFIVSNQKGS